MTVKRKSVILYVFHVLKEKIFYTEEGVAIVKKILLDPQPLSPTRGAHLAPTRKVDLGAGVLPEGPHQAQAPSRSRSCSQARVQHQPSQGAAPECSPPAQVHHHKPSSHSVELHSQPFT